MVNARFELGGHDYWWCPMEPILDYKNNVVNRCIAVIGKRCMVLKE